MNARNTRRSFRISLLIAALVTVQIVTVTHAAAHTLHGDSGTCFVCHASNDFKHCTPVAGVASTVHITQEYIVFRPTSANAPSAPRPFFARAPPPTSI